MKEQIKGNIGPIESNPNGKLEIVSGNIGIGETTPEHQIEIKCECGNKSIINTNFEINIVGLIQFKCNDCGKIINTTDCLLK